MFRLHRIALASAALAIVTLFMLYAGLGTAKPVTALTWMDFVGEGGAALMAAAWLVTVLASRPRGLVTRLLAFGLAGIMLAAWADCLDEFFRIPHEQVWDNWIEDACGLGGMVTLTVGLLYWRQEQLVVNQQLHKRERLFRDHRAFDRVTQLANADYLRRQIRAEQARRPRRPCAVVLLDIEHFHQVNQRHGGAEGDRALRAVGHMLLLNLRNDDLLCRYAGDRFAILLPTTGVADAAAMATHLCGMVAQMRHHAGDSPLRLRMRHAVTLADAAPELLLADLNRAIEAPPAVAAA
jgi:diguanylate cyclase (GGDEF)-like protein